MDEQLLDLLQNGDGVITNLGCFYYKTGLLQNGELFKKILNDSF